MQPFQPFYNINCENFIPESPPHFSQYAQSPQPFVIGEGDVASVVNPNGTCNFFFVPAMKPWMTITFHPNLPSYIHPYWYTDSGVWVVRSVSNPITWNMFMQMMQKYNSSVNELNFNNPAYQQSQLPNPTQQNQMEQHQIQFHSDSVTSTTDLQYFCPRPNTSVNTFRVSCDCARMNEMEISPPHYSSYKVNEMEVTEQSNAFHKMNATEMPSQPCAPQRMGVIPQFSPPQQVVCSKPCYCVHSPKSNRLQPNDFSFRQPYQSGTNEYATQTQIKENCNATASCRCGLDSRPYLPCFCPSRHHDLHPPPTTNKSRTKYSSSSDSVYDDGKSRSSRKTKRKKSNKSTKNSGSFMSVKQKKSKPRDESCRCAEEERNNNEQKRKRYYSNDSKSLYRDKSYHRNNTAYATYSSSSACEEELCKRSKKERNKKTCPVRKRRSRESVCTDTTCPVRKKKETKASCDNKTCAARKKKSEESVCNKDTCPAKKSKETIPPTSCNNQTCPAHNTSSKESTSSNESISKIRRQKSNGSVTSWNVQTNNIRDESIKSSSCDVTTCPERKEEKPCICPPKEEEEKPCICPPKEEEEKPCICPPKEKEKPCICPPKEKEKPCICPPKEKEKPCICPPKEKEKPCICPPKEEEKPCICPPKEKEKPCICPLKKKERPCICPPKEEEKPCICPPKEDETKSKKCNRKTCKNRKKKRSGSESEDSLANGEEPDTDTLEQSQSSDTETKKKNKNSSVMYVHKNERLNSCSDCSHCTVVDSEKKPPFSWSAYLMPTKFLTRNKKSKESSRCCKCCNISATTYVATSHKQSKANKALDTELSDDCIHRTAGKKYKPHTCCNIESRFLTGKRKKTEANDCTCSSSFLSEQRCCGCCANEKSTDTPKSTSDKHITTYIDHATNCAKASATQTKKCKCYPRYHKKHYIARRRKKDYKAELWEPKINCDFDCHQFLLDLRGSVPCLYSRN